MSRTISLFVALLTFAGFTLSGCGSSAEVNYDPGRVFVINNTRPPKYPGGQDYCVVRIWIEYDGQFYYRDTGLPRNMNYAGTCNYLEPVELTQVPLPGGTVATVTYLYEKNNIIEDRDITFAVDGNITVELYMQNWIYADSSVVYARIHKGRWSGPDSGGMGRSEDMPP